MTVNSPDNYRIISSDKSFTGIKFEFESAIKEKNANRHKNTDLRLYRGELGETVFSIPKVKLHSVVLLGTR